ncbi:MAG: hypothetical protein QOF78_3944 [Phycisphaerales bacterium]|jgi:SAM-dependent methyltransferase|nr:hypothetical protein [Phycisphaerales bacterium]
MRSVLNVGGGSRKIPIPEIYAGWLQVLLDIDPAGSPDIIMDAREMTKLPKNSYDAIYCSHNLEHYHRHDAERVCRGFLHVLKPNGFADIRVPDVLGVMHAVVQRKLDLDDVLYVVDGLSPILVRDVLFGYHVEIERTGNDFFAHKTGFSMNTLGRMLVTCGFKTVHLGSDAALEIRAFAFKSEVTVEQARTATGIPLTDSPRTTIG